MAEVAGDVLVGDSEESAGAAAGVIDRVAQFRLDRVDHRPDDLARGEELSTVGVLLTHLEQEVLIHLREREKMRVVHMINADLVHLVKISRRFVSLSTRTRSTAVMIRPITRCFRVAVGFGSLVAGSISSACRCGSSPVLMNSKSFPSPLENSSCRFQP